MKRVELIPTEFQEQVALFQWARLEERRWPELKLMHHIANGGSRHPLEAKNLKAEGVKAGIPDIFLPCARGGLHGMFIEMKRQKGGKVSPAQRDMLEALRDQGYMAIVCRGFDEAREAIMDYLRMDK